MMVSIYNEGDPFQTMDISEYIGIEKYSVDIFWMLSDGPH